ncbi:pyridoxamine 5'-phosphate oxidase family protein [Modestobacter excelsi]|uniref:pyridoxamine 5'-phosphate oxidase family protein n=1 Tax=Modestobacter excelsi TaxID=2213161 RepID=UPI001C20E4E8|nr:pyridoxamine 5'-phosphate oxidase family protein [Modestobacter excelsi]
MDATNLAELYGTPLVDWAQVEGRLSRGLSQAPGSAGPGRHTCWLATSNADGTPHLTGIGALWTSRTFWFETGTTTRKGRNLARDPRCSLSVATDETDLVVDGTATRVDDPALVAELAGLWAADGWPARVDATGTGADGGVQRSLGGAATVARPPHRGPAGHGAAHRRPRRGHPRWRF